MLKKKEVKVTIQKEKMPGVCCFCFGQTNQSFYRTIIFTSPEYPLYRGEMSEGWYICPECLEKHKTEILEGKEIVVRR